MLKNKLLWIALLAVAFLAVGCRYDMQDQPRYKAYKKSDFFPDGRASRDLPEGVVPRGMLRENKALYTGKTEGGTTPAAPVTSTDAAGNTVVTSFPGLVDEFPIPVTKELLGYTDCANVEPADDGFGGTLTAAPAAFFSELSAPWDSLLFDDDVESVTVC